MLQDAAKLLVTTHVRQRDDVRVVEGRQATQRFVVHTLERTLAVVALNITSQNLSQMGFDQYNEMIQRLTP
jgi:hypothetical protein